MTVEREREREKKSWRVRAHCCVHQFNQRRVENNNIHGQEDYNYIIGI